MTQTAVVRLMLLAAGAGVSVTEFRDFIDAIHKSSPAEILHAYNEIRRKMRQIQVSEDEQIGFEFASRSRSQTIRQDIAQLIRGSNIQVSDAVERIRENLLNTSNIDSSTIPEFNTSFARWVERVAKAVGPSTLLNAAISALTPDDTDNPPKWRLRRS